MRLSDVVFYLRSLIGFIMGFISALISGLEGLPFPLTWLSAIALTAAIYYSTYKVLRKFLRGKLRKKDIALAGIEAYIFTWLFSWTLFYTIFYMAS